MKFSKYILATLLALASIASWGSDKMRANINLTSTVAVGSSQLSAGEYTINWNGTGENVVVTFAQHGQAKATTHAQLQDVKSGYGKPVVEIDTSVNSLKNIALPKHKLSFDSVPDDTGK
jgi:hypothetical protein